MIWTLIKGCLEPRKRFLKNQFVEMRRNFPETDPAWRLIFFVGSVDVWPNFQLAE